MKRRNFLKSLFGCAAIPLVAKEVVAKEPTWRGTKIPAKSGEWKEIVKCEIVNSRKTPPIEPRLLSDYDVYTKIMGAALSW